MSAGMNLAIGSALIIVAWVGLQLTRPKDGKPRSFVNTSLEVPVTLVITGAFGVGLILTIAGIGALWS